VQGYSQESVAEFKVSTFAAVNAPVVRREIDCLEPVDLAANNEELGPLS
jgi:hypothetical protein